MIKKKAVSPIISVILIILVTVILTTIFLTWGKTSLKENLQDSQDALKPVGDIDCLNYNLFVDSCKIYSSKKLELLLINSTNIRYFDLILTIEGKDTDDVENKWVGQFTKSLSPGSTEIFNTDQDFIFLKNDSLSDLNITEINSIILTNGACKKEIINLINVCEIIYE